METKYNHTQETKLMKVNPSIILARYDDKLTRDSLKLQRERYKATPALLNSIDYNSKNGVVLGCNFFYKTTLANIARELSGEDIIPMTQLISELFLYKDELEDISDTNEDSGFTRYPIKGRHPKLWARIGDQTRTYFPNIDLNQPFVVEGLINVIPDTNYSDEYGLRIDFNKDGLTLVTQVPVLSKGDGKFSSKDLGLLKTGFPYELDKKGDRNLHTAKYGVRRFDRNGSNLNASYDGLDSSGDAGRMHFAKNFSGLNLEEIANNESLIASIRKNALERAKSNYEARKRIIETA